jgi:hypothetical protein
MNTRIIELTNSETTTRIWIRAAHIEAVLDNGSGSTVSLAGVSYIVNETYDDIVARLRVALH